VSKALATKATIVALNEGLAQRTLQATTDSLESKQLVSDFFYSGNPSDIEINLKSGASLQSNDKQSKEKQSADKQ